MTATPTVSPFRTFPGDGSGFDWFMVPFDKRGNCTGPRTRDHIINRASDATITDVFIFSHGWNNDWNVATDRYADFIAGYMGMRQELGLKLSRDFNPLLVGVFWPSTVLVFGTERGIDIAAGGAGDRAASVEEARLRNSEVTAVAEMLTGDDLQRFYELVDAGTLDEDEARELVQTLAPILDLPDDDFEPHEQPRVTEPDTVDSTLQLWRKLSALDAPRGVPEAPEEIAAEFDGFGLASGTTVIEGAGLLDKINPRNIVRAATVLLMKDRAGTVGAKGLGSLLVNLLDASQGQRARVHLVGHSYGAKVCLSAVCYPPRLPRAVSSMLLLQPAISHRCFADGDGGRGGYASAPARVSLPILATFSEHDVPLRRLFELAARRRDDRDEKRIASGEPGRYAALGGYGPRGLGDRSQLIDVLVPAAADTSQRYDLTAAAPGVYGVDATTTISGHGDVSNPSTWWALYNLVSAELR